MKLNMEQVAVTATGFVLMMFAKCISAVDQPAIHVYVDPNPDGVTCEPGQYFAGDCNTCSPCPDFNYYAVPGGHLGVFGDCLQQGLCPEACSEMYLEPHQQANTSFCSNLPLPPQQPVCGLSCLHGGTLDASDCRCTCDKGWTGNNCSEPVTSSEEGNLSTQTSVDEPVTDRVNVPTKSSVEDGESFPLYVLGIIFGVVIAVSFIWFIVKRFRWRFQARSLYPDMESLSFIECQLDICEITQQSISVTAKYPSIKFNGKKMRFSCRRADSRRGSLRMLSPAQTWTTCVGLEHTFENLRPGVTYVISLHQHRDVRHPVKTKEATTYFPLSAVMNGASATIRGLKDLHINAVQVCPCLMLPSCKKWITIPIETEEYMIPNVPPGFEFWVQAGVVDKQQLPSQQKFRCLALGRIDTRPQGNTQDLQRTSNCTTFKDALKTIDLKKALQVEFEAKDSRDLPEIVANALDLHEDDHRTITVARSCHVDKLDDILTSTGNETKVHDLIEILLPYIEAEHFLIHVVCHTWNRFQCRECIRLLHQRHSSQHNSI